MLTIASPFDEENYGAASLRAFIGDILGLFNKNYSNLIFMVGDNTPVNKSLSDLLMVPFIGCASHRFNLACKYLLHARVRAIFDAAIEMYPSLEFYLKDYALIVHSPAFESGIVKVLDDEVDPLSVREKSSISCFSHITDNILAEDYNLSLVQKALRNKRKKLAHGEYASLNFVGPSSNFVERLFSNAGGLIVTDYRKSMSPYTFDVSCSSKPIVTTGI